MVQHHIPCFVIADGGRARFVFAAPDNALHTRETIEASHGHDRSSDLGSDRPGRTFESASTTRHAIAPRHDRHEMEKEKFAGVVARRISAEAKADAFNELILVAPSHILTEIQESLDAAATTRLVGTLAKDLTKVPDEDLYPHLREWVRPTHRA